MATINGELSSLGPGSGAAVVLRNDPTALGILSQGMRARELRAQRDLTAKQKRDAELAKEFNDRLQYKTSGDPYYGQALQDRVYSGVEGRLAALYSDPNLSSFERTRQSAAIKQEVENQGVRATADAKAYDDLLGGYEAKPELYNTGYAKTYLAGKLHTADGKRALPNEVDALGIQRDLAGDANLYNEKGWIDEAARAHNLFPERSEKYATAGTLGGIHTLNEAKVRLVKTDGQGRAIMNADGTAALDIKDADITALKSIPQVKLLLDKRVADYNQQREKDPSLPQMSERGHIAQMVSRLATYDQSRTTGLNAQARAAPAGDKPKYITNDPTVGGFAQTSAQTAHDKGLESGSATNHQFAAPIRESKTTGKREQFSAKGVVLPEYVENVGGQNSRLVVNNQKPQDIIFGPARRVLKSSTGNIIRPTKPSDTKDEAAYEAWYKRAKAADPKLKGEWVVQVTPQKGENELADVEGVLAELEDANDLAPIKSRKSRAELRAQAQKLASGRNASYDVPYTPDIARQFRAFTGDYYDKGIAASQKRIDEFEARTTPSVTGPATLLQPGAGPVKPTPIQPTGANRFRKPR